MAVPRLYVGMLLEGDGSGGDGNPPQTDLGVMEPIRIRCGDLLNQGAMVQLAAALFAYVSSGKRMILWCISDCAELDGREQMSAPARWHSRGRRVVYLAESAAGAMLEALAHLDPEKPDRPAKYKLLKAEAPDEVPIASICGCELPPEWKDDQAVTRAIGDEWLAQKQTLLMRVPSAVVAETWNVLFNPEHADAERVKVLSHEEHRWDDRVVE